MNLHELKAERRRRDILCSTAHAFKKKGCPATMMKDISASLEWVSATDAIRLRPLPRHPAGDSGPFPR